MGRRTEGDEELAAIGVRSGVRHGEHADAVMAQVGMKLVLERVARTAVALPKGVAALNDEAVDDAMKGDAVVVRLLVTILGLRMRPLLRALSQADEVGHGLRRFLIEEFHGEVAERRLEVRVSGHTAYSRRDSLLDDVPQLSDAIGQRRVLGGDLEERSRFRQVTTSRIVIGGVIGRRVLLTAILAKRRLESGNLAG